MRNNKGKISTILIVILAIVVLAGAFVVYWFNRPIYKVNKAIEANDIETVAKYFGKLSAEDKEEVQKQMVVYCGNLNDDYIEEDIEYDDIMEQYDILGEEVLEGNETFEFLLENTKLLKVSREAYVTGMAAYEKGEYEKALEDLKKVVSDDKNYKKALKAIKDCENKLLPDVDGVWVCGLDVGKAIAKKASVFMLSEISFNMNVYMQFNKDGTGMLYIDKDELKEDLYEYMDKALDKVLEAYAKNIGLTKKAFELSFKKQYGMSIKEYLLSLIDVDNNLALFTSTSMEFDYVLEGDKVTITSKVDGSTNEFKRVYDEIQIEAANDALTKEIKKYGIDMPLVFKRIENK